MHCKLRYRPNHLHCKFYVIHNVHVLTINIQPKKSLRNTPFMTHIDSYMFGHRGATIRESLEQTYISQHANIFFLLLLTIMIKILKC